MLRHLIPITFILGGSILIGSAAYMYTLIPAGPALALAEPDLIVGDCVEEAETEVVFRLENKWPRPVRVIGLGEC